MFGRNNFMINLKEKLKKDLDVIVKQAKTKSGVDFFVKISNKNIQEKIYLKIKSFKKRPLLNFIFSENVTSEKVKLMFEKLKEIFSDISSQKDFLNKYEITNYGCKILVHEGDEKVTIEHVMYLKFDLENWEIEKILN